METIIIGIIAASLCVLYGIASHLYAKKDKVIDVEAGPTSECHRVFLKEEAAPKIIKLPNGKLVSSRNFVRIRIRGNCMEPRSIFNGEQWLVDRIDHKKAVGETIKKGDVVLIYLKDKNLFKIREVENINSTNFLDTIRYNNGERIKSSKPHSYSDVIGIVKYAI